MKKGTQYKSRVAIRVDKRKTHLQEFAPNMRFYKALLFPFAIDTWTELKWEGWKWILLKEIMDVLALTFPVGSFGKTSKLYKLA